MAKFLTIPQDIEIEIDTDRVAIPPKLERIVLSFVRYFIAYLLDEPSEFGSDRAGLFLSADIEAAFKGHVPGDVVELGDGMHAKLTKACEKRNYQQGQTVWRKLVPFFRALENASDKPPAHAPVPPTPAAPAAEAPKLAEAV